MFQFPTEPSVSEEDRSISFNFLSFITPTPTYMYSLWLSLYLLSIIKKPTESILWKFGQRKLADTLTGPRPHRRTTTGFRGVKTSIWRWPDWHTSVSGVVLSSNPVLHGHLNRLNYLVLLTKIHHYMKMFLTRYVTTVLIIITVPDSNSISFIPVVVPPLVVFTVCLCVFVFSRLIGKLTTFCLQFQESSRTQIYVSTWTSMTLL